MFSNLNSKITNGDFQGNYWRNTIFLSAFDFVPSSVIIIKQFVFLSRSIRLCIQEFLL